MPSWRFQAGFRIRTVRLEAKFVMDDNSKSVQDALVECPSCHHKVPARTIIAIVGRRLCLGCASAWSDDEDEDE